MEINLSKETIEVVCRVLRSERHSCEYCLKYKIPHGKMHINRKEILEQQLAEVEEALQVFEELID